MCPACQTHFNSYPVLRYTCNYSHFHISCKFYKHKFYSMIYVITKSLKQNQVKLIHLITDNYFQDIVKITPDYDILI